MSAVRPCELEEASFLGQVYRQMLEGRVETRCVSCASDAGVTWDKFLFSYLLNEAC